ncbi:hypothetical protein AAD018_013725 [Aestuariibius insulae]|uniref:hypothetical protein n=1 Tax=Aestuariibius insulae TaxID=2058287 RepID=UPI00345EFBA8
MARWPAGVPCRFQIGSLVETGPIGNVIATSMSSGPVKTRRRYTAAPREVSFVTGVLTADQVAAFEAWFADVLKDGVLPFEMPHPRTRVETIWRFVGGADPYSLAYRSPSLFTLSFRLEILP